MFKIPPFILTIVVLFMASCSTPSLKDELILSPENIASEIELEILGLVNEYRSSKGLNVLDFDGIAYNYAAQHTDEMISDGQISHDNFDVRSSNLAQQANANYVSENVGKSFTTAKAIVEAWIKSDTHRKVMEGDFLYTAVSVKADSSGTLYFTQLFYK
ncbi:CAP domain-containing protein [Flagellimonas taeanensis]|uniref:CAP domain-containing protein n=1 Tax=Flavobacteriaceae TaxID=49546 RepID=UPI000E68CB34|nr:MULTISPECIES: CAP domain-containing protein [Allomuricauda]MDC6385775.1 CAP domain-containing protein [Muricauda sp. SK9]RIV51128.1 CAP domain-containing protein [Allomuricauda taeanensis]